MLFIWVNSLWNLQLPPYSIVKQRVPWRDLYFKSKINTKIHTPSKFFFNESTKTRCNNKIDCELDNIIYYRIRIFGPFLPKGKKMFFLTEKLTIMSQDKNNKIHIHNEDYDKQILNNTEIYLYYMFIVHTYIL